MKNRWKTTVLAMLVLSMMLGLCGCGSSSSGKSQAAVPAESYSYGSNSAYQVYADYDMAEAEEESWPVPAPAMAGGFSESAALTASGKAASDGQEQTAAETPDKIIYSADVTVETTKFEETTARVTAMAESCGGWIESSSVSGSNYYQKSRGNASARDASYTLRIPSARFRELMQELTELGNIPYSHIYTENVTSQYYDSEARLKAYRTQEERLLEMMELAESVEDVITIEDRLTELRYQIESIQSRLNNWDRRVSYSAIYLTVKEVREYTPEEVVNPSYGEELALALKQGLRNAGEFVKNLLVFLVEALPLLVILLPLAWLVIWLLLKLIRRAGKGRAERKAARQAKRAAKRAAVQVPAMAVTQPAAPTAHGETAPVPEVTAPSSDREAGSKENG